MQFYEVLAQVIELLQRQGRVSYRALKRQFDLDNDYLEDLKAEIIKAKRLAVDEDGDVLVWTGGTALPVASGPATGPERVPRSYTPAHLTEKILGARPSLEGERKQVTVLFADLKGSMELLADRDPEEARQLLDPVLTLMLQAVHRYEGTGNQVMGDGIMALFGAPIAHEDHAVRACYAALHMQETVTRYGNEMQRAHGVPVQIRVGLHSGAVVVRGIDSSLHMDYTAVGQTTHLAARMEQMAKPGSVLLTAETLQRAEGHIQVKPLGPVAVKGLATPVEVFELAGAGPTRTPLQAFAARGLTRFVGRQQEIEALRQALGHAAAGHGQVVAVIGEPGVGKTRLCYEFTHSPRRAGGGCAVAGPRSAPTPPAHPAGPQGPAAAGESGAARAGGLREPALDRCRDAGPAGEPPGEPANGPHAPPGELPARVSTWLGSEELLYPVPTRSVAPGER
jgi:class 3 adenylate cyclase